jgi:hypothetical protein
MEKYLRILVVNLERSVPVDRRKFLEDGIKVGLKDGVRKGVN